MIVGNVQNAEQIQNNLNADLILIVKKEEKSGNADSANQNLFLKWRGICIKMNPDFQTADNYEGHIVKKKKLSEKKFDKKVTKKNVTKSLFSLKEKHRIILKVLLENPEGLRTPTLKKLTNIAEKTLYRHLNSLKDDHELIEKYSTIWKICQNQTTPLKVTKLLENDSIQIHDISYVVKLIKVPDWWEKRENNLRRLKEYQFKKTVNWSNNPYVQLLKDHFLIHCFKNSIVFINKKKYWGEDPYECFIESLSDFLEAFKYFEERTKFKFFIDQVPHVSIKSNHIVKIGDYLNKRCEKRGDKFQVNINDERRVLVDMSDPKGTEFVNKDYAPEDTQRYGRIVEDVIKNNPPTLSELTNTIGQNNQQISNLTQNWDNYGKHIKSHIKAIQQLGDGVEKQNAMMGELLQAIRGLKK